MGLGMGCFASFICTDGPIQCDGRLEVIQGLYLQDSHFSSLVCCIFYHKICPLFPGVVSQKENKMLSGVSPGHEMWG